MEGKEDLVGCEGIDKALVASELIAIFYPRDGKS